MTLKFKIQQVRRQARVHGMTLHVSRTEFNSLGNYYLCDDHTGNVVAYGFNTIEQVLGELLLRLPE